MIKNISIMRIHPHPDNPRRELGDLTELAASIKAQDVLQNLTVVSSPDLSEIWRVVIGHRRLAAAKLAGLDEVPCVISDMDAKTQISTMLLENMQRTDLTVWEQAQGFQTLLDFGETIDSVAELTGFSETTVRRRVKLLELDQEKFQQSVGRGGTLDDYAELDKINDVKTRNKVLESVGTSEFGWKLRQAVDAEKAERNKATLIAKLEKFATKVKKTDGLRQVEWFGYYSESKVKKPADAGEAKYFFTVDGHQIVLYKESGAEPEPVSEYEIKRRQQMERQRQLEELHKRAAGLRDDFVRNFGAAKRHAGDILSFALRALLEEGLGYGDDKRLAALLDIEIPKADSDRDRETAIFQAAFDAFDAAPEKVLLLAAYCSIATSNNHYYNWRGEFSASKALDTAYDALEKLGYELSEEELALRSGTHRLYLREEAKGDAS